MSGGDEIKKPSDNQLCKYAILVIVHEQPEIDFDTLHQHTGFESKRLVRMLGKLIQWHEIKKKTEKNKHTTYIITKTGKRKLEYFKEKGYGEYWVPVWEEKRDNG